MTVAAISIIKASVQAIIAVYIGIGAFDYIGVENVDDTYLPVLIVAVFLVAMLLLCLLPLLGKPGLRNRSLEEKYRRQRNQSIAASMGNVGWILLFLLITDHMIITLCRELLSTDYYELIFYLRLFMELEDSLMMLAIVSLIGNLLIVFACSVLIDGIAADEDDEDDFEPVYEEPRSSVDYAPPVNTSPVHTPPPPKAEEEKVETVICPACGFEQPGGRRICWRCSHVFGKAVKPKDVFCAACGNILDKDSKFCGKCGNKVD